ncbi:FkbM family methyltransferase [Mesorhizobium cantuariense]|uniref:FkbM family methyltransferase n=1 Tax=Mesorhizobium cantuariense TaxID=1300275 RepID=A0ABV7MQN5_9HYPH
MRDRGFEILTTGRKTVTVRDITLSLDGVSRRMRYVMARGYEAQDAALASRVLNRHDRVLEAGSAIGFMALNCMIDIGIEDYCMVEANPRLEASIRENFRLNGISLPVLKTVAVGPSDGSISFGISRNFWSSSALRRDNEAERLTVSMLSIPTIVSELPLKPNVLIMDIEGAETSIPPNHFEPFEKLIIEFHPKLTGPAEALELERDIISRGFTEFGRVGGTIAFIKAQ